MTDATKHGKKITKKNHGEYSVSHARPIDQIRSPTMRSTLILVSVVTWLAIVSAQEVAPVRHIGMSKSETIQSCAAQAFGHPVVLSDMAPLLEHEVSCSTPPEELADLLRLSGFAVFESDEWVYLIPLGQAAGPNRVIQWNRFEIAPMLGNLEAAALTTALKDADLQKLWRLIRSSVRMVPVTVSFLAQGPGGTGTGQMVLDASLVKMSDTLESVVGIVREPNGPGRVIVGRRSSDGFTISWDSPLLNTRDLAVGFEDVDGDGVREILVRSACCGLRPTGEALEIFSVEGDELTRQTDCELDGNFKVAEKSSASCPVVGERLQLESGPGSTKAITGYRLKGGKKMRYVLKNRRFVSSQ
jgi:hypothetical protein